MQIAIAGFYHESNTFSPLRTSREDFVHVEGEDLLEYFPGAVHEFRQAGAQIIPCSFAGWISSGVILEDAYRWFVNRMVEQISAARPDGVWLQLHGAIYVEDIGSGELFLVRKLRKALGYTIPVAIAFDPHGNLSPDIVQYANIIRAYHTAPHTDQQETYAHTARVLVDFVQRGVKVEPAFARLPMLLNGDTALTREEPLCSIIAEFKELEQTPKIAAASLFISMHSANTENTYPAVVVVPSSQEHKRLAEDIARKIAHRIYDQRHLFRFEADLVLPEQAVEIACTTPGPVVVSDSGDNTTAGGTGMNTVLLRLLLKRGELNGRKALVSTIYDPEAYRELSAHSIGDEVKLSIGTGIDGHSQPVQVKGVIKAKGSTLLYLPIRCNNKPIAGVITLSCGDVDITVTQVPDSFTDLAQCAAGGFNAGDYDIIVIKQAYQFPDMVKLAKTQVMAKTPGATYQDLDAIKEQYTKIPWSIFPFEQ